MFLFSSESYRHMAEALAKDQGVELGSFCASRFDNGELHIRLHNTVKEQLCFILGSISPPDEQLLSTLLLANTLKKEGAAEVLAVIPYLAYARHDKDKSGESLATAWIGSLAQASGINRLIAIDVHSERGRNLFPIPVLSFSPARIFAEALKQYGLGDVTIVAPDEGAIARCQSVRQAAGMPPSDVAFFKKHRISSGVVHEAPVGKISREVLLVDDILDTGGTLVSACEKLVQAGADEIHIMITHGLFTGVKWKELWRFDVKQIFCTDSVPPCPGFQDGRIVRLSVVPLLRQQIAEIVKAARQHVA